MYLSTRAALLSAYSLGVSSSRWADVVASKERWESVTSSDASGPSVASGRVLAEEVAGNRAKVANITAVAKTYECCFLFWVVVDVESVLDNGPLGE